MKITWRGKSAVIVFHESTTGPPHDLRDYLLEHGLSSLLFISHPLLYLPEFFDKSSTYTIFKHGKIVKTGVGHHWKLPEALLYIKDLVYTWWWIFRYMPKSDVYVGVGNLNVLIGLALRFLGRTKTVIYYVIDYVPQRFSNPVVNYVYHLVERIAASQADWTWNLSPRMISGREKRWGRAFPHQLVVPHGVHFDRITRVPLGAINRYEILYMGSLLEKQGVQLIIEALPSLIRKIPRVTFTIIGKGPYETMIKKLIETYHIGNHVHMMGYIADHHEMENRIAKAAIAVALYDKEHDIFSYYADPGKIRNYLGAGVPVLMTDVPYVARDVKNHRCGLVITYSKEAVADALYNYFRSPDKIKTMRKNALAYAKQYNWDAVFDHAFSYILWNRQ